MVMTSTVGVLKNGMLVSTLYSLCDEEILQIQLTQASVWGRFCVPVWTELFFNTNVKNV